MRFCIRHINQVSRKRRDKMSNYEKAQRMRKEFDESDVFGGKITFRQIWWIIKFAKTVRKFARSNAALYNLCNDIFKGVASFKDVTKTREDGTTYPGLQIAMIVNGVEVVESEKDSDEE